MTSRKKDIEDRKDRILGITIEQYIDSVTPVSSACIARQYPLDVSPATVRNILAELEDEGYLTHPHTSAGRIPTHKGYRYYVDHLMHEIKLLENEKMRIHAEYAQQSSELEELLENTSRVISDMTQYTSIISVDGWDNKVFTRGTNLVVGYPDLQDLSKIENILTALEEKDKLLEVINQELAERINIFIGQEIALRQINSCSLVISRYKTKSGPSGRIAVLGPTRMNYERVVTMLDYFSRFLEEIE